MILANTELNKEPISNKRTFTKVRMSTAGQPIKEIQEIIFRLRFTYIKKLHTKACSF